MKIKMLETKKGSPDGINVKTYIAGQVYEIPASLANVFVNQLQVGEEIKIETPEKDEDLETPEKNEELEIPEKEEELEIPEKDEDLETPEKVIKKGKKEKKRKSLLKRVLKGRDK